MREKRALLLLMVSLMMAGCMKLPVSLPVIGGSATREIPMETVDNSFKSALPKTRKSSFGRVKLLAAALQPSKERQVEVVARFRLVTFEIPEGIDGLLRYGADLRYDPRSGALYLTRLTPQSMTFGNPSLEEYVSTAARKGVPGVIASLLASIPLASLENLPAKSGVVESAKIEKGKLVLTIR